MTVPMSTSKQRFGEMNSREEELMEFIRQVANCELSDNQNIRKARELVHRTREPARASLTLPEEIGDAPKNQTKLPG